MNLIEKSIQFLVSPQQDFIGRLEPGSDTPPNTLHVGEEAIKKLRGSGKAGVSDPFVETTLKLYDPSISGSERVHVILDEDWHNSNSDEFAIYGRHCVKGTKGAQLVGSLEDHRWEEKTHVLRANSINQASDRRYSQILESIVGSTRTEHIRVGIYGVWTNIKVEYLAVNLMTLAPHFQPTSIAVCEPLTAAPNEEWHRQAIDKFGLLGINVFDSIPDYLEWMGLNN